MSRKTNRNKKPEKTKAHNKRILSNQMRLDIIYDYILNNLSQRSIATKYKCSTHTVNDIVKPQNIADLIINNVKLNTINSKDLIIIKQWFSNTGNESYGRIIERETQPEKHLTQENNNGYQICNLLQKANSVAALGLHNVVAKLTNNLKEAQSTKEIRLISSELRAIFEQLSPFNPEINSIINTEQPLVQNNIQLNMAATLAEIMKTDPVFKAVLPIRTIENPNQNEKPTVYEPPKEPIDFKERAAQPPAGESLLEDTKRDETEEPPEGENQANIIDVLVGI
ncbi:MAG: hypothetical protein KA807_17915 [Prolixibacteraceae bacterium]|nr:hypothetical protein [Prolixibacteraceae bacterium]